MVVSKDPEGFLVKARGLESDVEMLRMRGVRAVVDASGVKTGAVRLPVEYQIPPELRGRVEIPGRRLVSFAVDRKISKAFPVEVPPVGQAPAGYEFKIPVANPNQVRVAGLESAVNRVDRVVATLDIPDGGAGAISQEAPLVAQDVRRQVVENVEIRPERVDVFVGLKERRPLTTLWLSSRFVGTPAPGFEYAGHALEPQFVQVQGPVERLAGLSSLPVTVDLEGLKENVTRTVTLRPPGGVQIVGSPQVSVTIQIRPRTHPAGSSVPESPSTGNATTPEPAGDARGGGPPP
jgi:YbbR domain-containing protein